MAPNMFCLFIFSLLLCYVDADADAQACRDIDTTACQTMSQNRPDLCSDMTIAKTACPKFCNLCPLVCYYCNATVQDAHYCTTTKTCGTGQVCMRKELKSIFDGHHEYEMTCADKQACDTPWSGGSILGRRHIVSRDLTVTCCLNDLCNSLSPTTAPKPGCVKDLILAVDETTDVQHFHADIKQFLYDVVNGLPVSHDGVHVALGLFSDSARSIFDLNELNSKNETLSVLRKLTFRGGHDGDATQGAQYVLENALTPAAGDRSGASNIVLFISAHGTHHARWLYSEEWQLHGKAEVISVDLGKQIFHYLATDAGHEFVVSTNNELQQIIPRVLDFICKVR